MSVCCVPCINAQLIVYTRTLNALFRKLLPPDFYFYLNFNQPKLSQLIFLPTYYPTWSMIQVTSLIPSNRRSLNKEVMSDICWTLSMYLEAVAMLPQIYMFQRQAADEGGIVEVRRRVWSTYVFAK